MDRIVVMGGSFNPPTKAHRELMRAAADSIGAAKGIFVPAAYEYVAKKMKKQKCPGDTLSEAIRVEALESICKADARLSVSRIRLGQGRRGYDYEMMLDLQKENPGCELYFLVGSDKLYILSRWHRIDEFLRDFRILAVKRGEDDLDKIRELRPYIDEHWDSFTFFSLPDGLGGISSTAFREKLHGGDETAREMVTQEVWEILDRNGKIPWNTISGFRDEYRFLSNFYEAEVTYGGLTYGSSEAAFQAQKCVDEAEKKQFTEFGPGKSKGVGRNVKLRPDWEEVKTGIMEEIVRAKFTQHAELAALLLATGKKILVEGNRWGDTFWGVDTRTGQGENRLGRILMNVRDELRGMASGKVQEGGI